MKQRKNMGLWTSLLGAAFVVSSCGGDGGGLGSVPESTVSLNDAEQDAISRTIAETLTVGIDSPFSAKLKGEIISRILPAIMQTASGEAPIEDEILCGLTEEDGKVVITGKSKATASETSYKGSVDTTADYRNCKVDAEGTSPVLNGELKTAADYNFSFSFEDGKLATVSQGLESFSGSIKTETVGGIDVTGSSGDGVCGVGVDSTYTFSSSAITYKVVGSVCGVDVGEERTLDDFDFSGN